MTEKTVFPLRRRIGIALAGAAVAALAATGVGFAGQTGPDGRVPLSVDPADCESIPAEHDPAVIRVVHEVGVGMGASEKVMLAGFEAGWVESHMNNLPCGDKDSLGVFQQRPSQGWGTPEQIMDVDHAATRFFTQAIHNEPLHPDYTAGLLAQSVQRSCCPQRYDQAEGKALELLAEAASGRAPGRAS